MTKRRKNRDEIQPSIEKNGGSLGEATGDPTARCRRPLGLALAWARSNQTAAAATPINHLRALLPGQVRMRIEYLVLESFLGKMLFFMQVLNRFFGEKCCFYVGFRRFVGKNVVFIQVLEGFLEKMLF